MEHDDAPRQGTGAADADQALWHQERHRVGVFNRCLLLFKALALPRNGKFMAIDEPRLLQAQLAVLRPGPGHAQDGLLCVDPTLKHLHALLTDQANHSAFDFVFVDADSQTDDSSPNPL